ncbi:MAG: hypothetical protein RQ723_02850, partial [Desulfuromonadales bacterium]|nr:hypothetical protein [Desulfuromonadales bacterium]
MTDSLRGNFLPVLACCCLMLACVATPLDALAASDSLPVNLQADTLDSDLEAGLIDARGDVELRRGPTRLRAERLLWQNTTQDVLAQDAVELTSAEADLSGDRLRYNLATQQGEITGGRVFLPQGNFHLTGD